MIKLKDLSPEIRNEILDFVQQKTGASSMFMILNDTPVPCTTVVAGLGCIGDHEIMSVHRGIGHTFLFGVVMSRALDIGEAHGMSKEKMLEAAEEMIDMQAEDDKRP